MIRRKKKKCHITVMIVSRDFKILKINRLVLKDKFRKIYDICGLWLIDRLID